MRRFLLLALLLAGGGLRAAEDVTVAAAANLIYALDTLAAEFRKTEPATRLTVTTGASGNLFAQMKNGAPFDVFLSADTDYPQQLVDAKLGDPATLRRFATGRLVLWTTRAGVDVRDLAATVRNPAVNKIAIAQPKTAPYGRAARAALEKVGAWSVAEPKLVVGENITQATQFVETGNADAGFVALSVVLSPRLKNRGTWAEIPPALYAGTPLDHAGVLTNRGAANPAAKRFLAFLASDAATKILRDYGYGVP